MIYSFFLFVFVQKSFLTKNFLLYVEINLTTRGPLYPCLVMFACDSDQLWFWWKIFVMGFVNYLWRSSWLYLKLPSSREFQIAIICSNDLSMVNPPRMYVRFASFLLHWHRWQKLTESPWRMSTILPYIIESSDLIVIVPSWLLTPIGWGVFFILWAESI